MTTGHQRPTEDPAAPIGVIGGSGFYQLLDDAREVKVDTPYGPPSDLLAVGTVAGRQVAFLPRHGRGHALPPHRINYRANLWALRALGVRQVLAPCAVGSLRRDLPPGALVVPDQLVDRTSGRVQSYFDEGALHVQFADPYCGNGRRAAVAAARARGTEAHDGGTMVVVEGPRFSTRAESQWFAAAGWSIVNMTGHPEAVLARELALCYTPLALVTDVDAGIDAAESVAQEDVFAVFARNIERLREIVITAVELLPEHRDCRCARALDGFHLPFELP
ncbi:S-methyl-5'-thioadenosine phosphorylase [Kitasatospora phosalacinea]|uniref:S-methyl-5'-thioadenosine phosphorylase n=1 Tax=Kitasatospora phosalacinea TaxID=2065 RepID=UPI0035E1FA37